MTLKPEWRSILKLRSVKDKVAVPIDCDMLEPGDLNIITDLVREGLIVWIDRAVLRQIAFKDKQTGVIRIGVNCDIYQLTTKGIRLCNENGIKQH